MTIRALLPTAGCVLGAAGVVAAAAAAHGGGGDTRLAAAAQILLAHAPAVLALSVAAAGRGQRLLFAAGWAMVAGAALFSADMAARHFGGSALFPMAAPLGGLVLIGAWLVAAVGLLVPRA